MAALIAATLVAAACGSGDPGTPAASGPATPALMLSGGGRSVSVAPSGGCVRRPDRVVCGDPPAPRCTDATVPRIPLAHGATLTMQFPERPRRVEASIGSGAPLREQPATATVSWRPDGAPTRPSPLVVLADLEAGRLAYTACVVPTG